MKMEVQTTAFGVNLAGDLGNTTFYRYRLTYRGAQPLTDAYVGFWVDADLGNATDDYVGSDTTLDMGFTYNADNFDEGSDGYGNAPPALGVTFLEAPEGGSARNMDVFLYYANITAPNGNPRSGTDEWYKYLQGIWQDDKPMMTCGDGYDPSGLACAATAQPTKVMWPGDPVTGAFWSERNFDGAGNANPANDRRFLMSSGPFTLQPGETQDFVYAIVWAKGDNNFDSVARLRQATTVVRNAWAQGGLDNIPLPAAPTAAPGLVAPADGAAGQPTRVVFTWESAEDATDYDVELASGAARDTLFSVVRSGVEISLDTLGALPAGAVVTWRVRGRNAGGVGPWSEAYSFTTTGEMLGGSLGGFADFLTVANASGPLSPPEYAAFAFNSSGFPHPTTTDRPDGSRQQTTADLAGKGWGIFTFGAYMTFDQWFDRVTRTGANAARIFPNAFEWRFAGSSFAIKQFEDGSAVTVPFELWNVGTQPGTEDDYRMIPILCESGCGAGGTDGVFDLGGDSPLSGAENDPISDAVYWYNPANTAPGTAGYDAYAADVASGNTALFFDHVGDEVLARIVLMGWNFGTTPAEYPQAMPEAGTIFRITSAPPTVSAPVPSAPLPGTELSKTATTLYWQQPDVPGAETALQIARDAAFTDLLVNATPMRTSYDVSALTQGTTYYWRVRQQTPGGLAGPWSAAQMFSVSATATAVETGAALPLALTLDAPWPNPARDRATVRFGLPTASEVRVALYDVLGREVQRLADGAVAAGWHEVRLETSSLASGVYLVRVVSEGRQQTRAVVIAR